MQGLLVFFFFLFIVFPAQATQLLEVDLATESTLVPIYLSPWNGEKSDFERSYLQALEKVWDFDFSTSGICHLLSADRAGVKGKKIDKSTPRIAVDVKEQARYIVAVELEQRYAFAHILEAATGAVRATEKLSLIGDMASDRRQVHRMADAVIKALFGTEGISSTSILYTVRSGAYAPSEVQWLSEIWECDYDGANAHPLIQGQGYCITPAYLPPRPGSSVGSLCYVSYLSGQPKIYVAALHSKEGRALVQLRGNQFMPALARRRDKLAFICDVSGNPDLFVVNFDPEKGVEGKPRQIFAARHATQGSPTFSPDGKKIAFVSNKDGLPKIYLLTIPVEGTPIQQIEAKLLTRLSRENTAPAWSPNGAFLAYSALTEGVRQLWLYDFNKDVERQLTFGAGHKENPSWAPNSLHVVYNVTTLEQSEIYFLNINQKLPQRIPLLGGQKRFPFWEVR